MAGWQEQIKALLAGITPREIPDLTLPRAAVLLPLVGVSDSEPRVLLTERTNHVRYHKGQISFPGGARDGAESLEATAVRETAEELGIDPGRIELFGRFHEHLSSSNFRVSVFVGQLDSASRLLPSQIEVARILLVPLRFFLNTAPETRIMRRRSVEAEVYFYQWEGHVIWGLTARILKEFTDALREAGRGG